MRGHVLLRLSICRCVVGRTGSGFRNRKRGHPHSWPFHGVNETVVYLVPVPGEGTLYQKGGFDE
jgi:hypothetical protein